MLACDGCDRWFHGARFSAKQKEFHTCAIWRGLACTKGRSAARTSGSATVSLVARVCQRSNYRATTRASRVQPRAMLRAPL
eukprot:3152004-Pleurochrysis_carterae.AAC.1